MNLLGSDSSVGLAREQERKMPGFDLHPRRCWRVWAIPSMGFTTQARIYRAEQTGKERLYRHPSRPD